MTIREMLGPEDWAEAARVADRNVENVESSDRHTPDWLQFCSTHNQGGLAMWQALSVAACAKQPCTGVMACREAGCMLHPLCLAPTLLAHRYSPRGQGP